jgi:hypothetical protein
LKVEIANGKTTPQACRDAQITAQTFYRWRKEYGGLKLDERDGEIMEAVRLARQRPFDGCAELNRVDTHDYVELKRTNGSITILQIVWRTLPRNGGRALLLRCPECETPRRHVYGWEWDSFSGWSNRVRTISWRCRS